MGKRVVWDLKKLNTVLKDKIYPNPSARDIIRKCWEQKGTIFSSIDLRSVFNQIPTDPESWYLLSTSCSYGNFLSKRMTFGCKSSPAYMEELMEKFPSKGRELDKRSVVWIDDILFGLMTFWFFQRSLRSIILTALKSLFSILAVSGMAVFTHL